MKKCFKTNAKKLVERQRNNEFPKTYMETCKNKLILSIVVLHIYWRIRSLFNSFLKIIITYIKKSEYDLITCLY